MLLLLFYYWGCFFKGTILFSGGRHSEEPWHASCPFRKVSRASWFFHISHCESQDELWLRGEAALQTQSFRDAEPQLGIPPKERKIMRCHPCSSDQESISAWPPLTPLYLALHGRAMMPIAPGAVNLCILIRQDNIFSISTCPLLWGSAKKSALKQGAGVLLKIGAKDLTVVCPNKCFLRHKYANKGFYKEFALQRSFIVI